MEKTLSNDAVLLLAALFHPQSNVQLPIGAAKHAVNVQEWIDAEMVKRGITLEQGTPAPKAPEGTK